MVNAVATCDRTMHSRVMLGHSAPFRIKTGRSYHVGEKSRDSEAESSLGSFERTIDHS
jgi:hypothetical protein